MTEHSAQPIHSLIVLAYFVPHSALIAKDFLSTQLASSLFMGEVSTASDLSSYYFIWKTRTIKNDSSQLSNYLSTSKLTRTPILSSFSPMSEKAVSYLIPKTKPSVYIFKFLSLLILVSFVSSCLCQLLPGSFLRQLLFSLYMLSLNDIYAYHFNYLLCADDFLIPISSLVHLFKTFHLDISENSNWMSQTESILSPICFSSGHQQHSHPSCPTQKHGNQHRLLPLSPYLIIL